MAATASRVVQATATIGRALISTIEPVSGGVPRMTAFVADALRRQGWQVTLAWYAPYRRAPELSVPLYQLGSRRPSARRTTALDDYEGHGIGAWLPELEFTHYRPGPDWRRLVEEADIHLSVSGSCLAAWPYVVTGRPFVAWVASPWEADRRDRVAHFPWPRRLLDRAVNAPVLRRMEKRILNSGTILPLSHYTARALDSVAGRPLGSEVLSMPVDTNAFAPNPAKTVWGRVGFSGRLDDPRKNVDLLLDAVALARREDPSIHALLLGGPADARLAARIAEIGLGGAVEVSPYVPHDQLPALLQTLDAFVVPSHQEGLCIAALEAMACGVPVVSTRCGGPEDYVHDGKNGFLVDSAPEAVAGAILKLFSDGVLHDRLAQQARRIVIERFSRTTAEAKVRQACRQAFAHD